MHDPFPAFWIFQDEERRWRWKFAAADGDFIAASSKPYATQHQCTDAIRLMLGAQKVAIFGTIGDLGSAPPAAATGGDSSAVSTKEKTLELEPAQILTRLNSKPFSVAGAPRADPTRTRDVS